MKIRTIVLVCAVGVAGAACASAKIPDENYAPDQTIAAAQERNAKDHPKAKLHLKLAQDQLAEAQKLQEEGEEDEAKLMMLRAQADADYALALLRNQDQQEETDKIRQKLQQLRDEMNPATTEE